MQQPPNESSNPNPEDWRLQQPPSQPLPQPYSLPPSNTFYPQQPPYQQPIQPPLYQQPEQYQIMPPSPSKKSKRTWVIVGMVIGGLILLVVISNLIPKLASKDSTTTSQIAQVTKMPTSTPTFTPTPTPGPPGTGDHMNLGSAYTNPTDGFTISHPKDTFSSKDQMAYVVLEDQPFNTFHLNLALVMVDSSGGMTLVITVPITLSDPKSNQLANQFLTSDLMGSNPPGQYRLEIENDSAIIAQVDFTYTG